MSESPFKSESEAQTLDGNGSPFPNAGKAMLEQCIKGLKSGHPLRIFVESWLAQPSVPRPPLALLLSYVIRPRPYFWRQQAVAILLLGMLPWSAEEQVVVRARLTHILTHWQFENQYWGLLRVFGSCFSFVSYITGIVVVSHRASLTQSVVMLMTLAVVLKFVATHLSKHLERPDTTMTHCAALFSLGMMHHVGDLSTILSLLVKRQKNINRYFRSITSPKAREDAQYATGHYVLAWFVYWATEADYDRLPNNTVPRLCSALVHCATSNVNDERVLRLIYALHKLGDRRALPTLNRLGKQNVSPTTQEVILNAIQAIEERESHLNATTTLLRASEESSSTTDTLLRAASESTDVDPSQLLRAQTTQNPPPGASQN